MNFINGTVLDGRIIRLEVDKGFREGRQYGRGGGGGQVCTCSVSGVLPPLCTCSGTPRCRVWFCRCGRSPLSLECRCECCVVPCRQCRAGSKCRCGLFLSQVAR